ncbi:Hypothetical predicted protein, partial [Podarcis lilfordi]
MRSPQPSKARKEANPLAKLTRVFQSVLRRTVKGFFWVGEAQNDGLPDISPVAWRCFDPEFPAAFFRIHAFAATIFPGFPSFFSVWGFAPCGVCPPTTKKPKPQNV